MAKISTLQGTIAAMTVQMSSLQKGRDVKDKDGAPEMHIKDVEKPSKFHGDKWLTWEDEFTTFLTRRDRRWKEVLTAIKAKSDKPLSPDGLDALRMDPTITTYMAKKEVFEAFKDQLYEYLKAFTSGDIHTMVLSNGVENSMESWRRLCDQGRSRRIRPLRDERRALFHPKQASTDTVIKAIAEWEKRLAEYISVVPGDKMTEADKIMCLEDICPEVLQKYLSDKYANGKIVTYLDYKDAIDNFFYEERRWTRVARGKLNIVTDPGENYGDVEEGIIEEYQVWDLPALAALGVDECCKTTLLGEINAPIKGGIGTKGKGKGKNGNGKGYTGVNVPNYTAEKPRDRPGKGSGPMDVDDRLCYECNQKGHIGKNCPIRQARIAAGGPAIIPKGKGKGKGGTGQTPNAQQWKAMYPGPSPTQW